MIDLANVLSMLRALGMDRWADSVAQPLRRFLFDAPHGDWTRWRHALDALPGIGVGHAGCVDGAWSIMPDAPLDNDMRVDLATALMALHPWRKGPYRVGEIEIDTEWRSDWKWTRIAPFIEPLDDRLVLDVGCGNGYHCWRMAEAGARQVIGIDPTALFLAQFLAVRRLMARMSPAFVDRVELIPVGIESVPLAMTVFDTIFSMGVLYHRRSPIDHLLTLRAALRPGGQALVETLVIDGKDDRVLVPEGRYAKMRNVWFIPTTAMLETWARRAGFRNVRIVDVTITTVQEQRSTPWMTFESLADFLDPADSRFTVEGHPAPRRAVLVANA